MKFKADNNDTPMRDDSPLAKAGRRSGMTVPNGYFDALQSRLMAQLPEQPWETAAPSPKATIWQKMRPYIYMAASFIGIWCMMTIFNHVKPQSMSPELIAALSDDSFIYDYFMDSYDSSEINQLWDDCEVIPAAVFSE